MHNPLPEGYYDAVSLQKKLHTTDEKTLAAEGEERVLSLFHQMAERVPAYKDFLSQRNLDPADIKSLDDLKNVPTIDKDNYLRQYPKEMLCWDAGFSKGSWVISTTSGSTGKPFYFPRQAAQDYQYAATAELYLRSNFNIHEKSTLYIVAFPMGAWIGGLFTYEALRIIAERGSYDLSIITPGIHKQEVINAVLQLGGSYDQIIIGAYAPFLKDILDDGTRQGIKWADYDVGFIFSAEAFSERFRDYVLKISEPESPLKSTLNHYGTVDLGTMAHETPETVMLRRELVGSEKLNLLFPEEHRQPTFCQYDPSLFYFEENEGKLICSSFSGIPLVRYDLKDYGGIVTREAAHKKLGENGVNAKELLEKNALSDTTLNLPYVYVYERDDFSVSYYAFLLYPDMVRRALQDATFEPSITGKFTMFSDYNAEGRQQLHIHVEKKFGVEDSPRLTNELTDAVHKVLISESSEYRETVNVVGEVVRPLVHLWDYEDPEYFKAGTKQRWVLK